MKKIIKNFLRMNNQFSKISYSQCGEDLIVKFIFDSIGIKKPSYIDIGAHHPYYLNNTAIFYSGGSLGINIEPDSGLFKEFLISRKNDINVNVGIAKEENFLDFYVMSTSTINSFSKEDAEDAVKQGYSIVEIKKIKVLPLDQIITEHANGLFPEFLTLDVEGLDMEILESIDYENNAPIVICVETISFSENGTGEKNTAINEFLQARGYLLYADTYINSIFVKKSKWINRGKT